MDLDDCTQTLESVMRAERSYPWPLGAADRRELFRLWIEANPEAVAEMEGLALAMHARGRPVSVQYLFEKQRWESSVRLNRIRFEDWAGQERTFGTEHGINHNDRHLFGLWLRERHPGMRVLLRRSILDEEDV
ncbi:hypothetical protein EII22_08775 [Coriobacteriales bacterium OH1046]|nr:hypothetical protein EII22_08775 [Coriobacteriales bacterium OH1046]